MIAGRRKPNFAFPADITPEGVLAEIVRNHSSNNPDIGRTQSCILRNGPQVFKFAIIHEIVDRHTKEHHHNALTLISCRRFKGGWVTHDERKIVLENQDADEIGILEEFINQFRLYTGQEKKSYGIVEAAALDRFSKISASKMGDTISEILEDADNYRKIVDQGGLNLLRDIVDWTFKQGNTQAIVEQLDKVNIDSLKELTTVAGISQINKILEVWQQNQDNSSEEFWQRTLSEFSWIVSQIFAAPVVLLKEKAYVGGKTLDNTGGNLVDYIYRNHLSGNVILIEIKTPCTEIIGKRYRQTYALSDEVSGAINQTLNYKHQLQQNFVQIQMADRGNVFEVINPRTLLVVGNLQRELSSEQSKVEAFELYRQSLKDVCVLTYDELFAKVEILKSILQNGK